MHRGPHGYARGPLVDRRPPTSVRIIPFRVPIAEACVSPIDVVPSPSFRFHRGRRERRDPATVQLRLATNATQVQRWFREDTSCRVRVADGLESGEEERGDAGPGRSAWQVAVK